MQSKRQIKPNTFFFKKWSGKQYAVFASLGKQICISVLSVSYSLISLPTYAQSEKSTGSELMSDTLPEVEITPDDEGILAFPVQASQTVEVSKQFLSQDRSELLEHLPGSDIRQRGNNGVQGDIQIRGGTPEQTMVLLNGIPLNDAQTGHHNLNLPIPDICISKAIVYTAGESMFIAPGAYNSVVSFITGVSSANEIKLHLFGGSYSLFGAEAMADLKTGKLSHVVAYSVKQSKGNSFNTDFGMEKVYYMLCGKFLKVSDIRVQAGMTNKWFGAQSFYSNKYPYQFEAVKGGFASVQFLTQGKIQFQPMFYWKRNYDRFELFRESLFVENNGYYIWGADTAKYVAANYEVWNYYAGHNYHLTNRLGTGFSLQYKTKAGTFKTALNYTHDRIYSTVLGELLTTTIHNPYEDDIEFNHKKTTDVTSLFVGFGSRRFGSFRINTGVLAMYNQNQLKPGGGISLIFSKPKCFSAWLSANLSQRLPTFTELYYKSTTNIGNENLKAEDAINTEIGFSFSKNGINLQNRIFIIDGFNTIDWVRNQDENVYRAMNHTQIVTFGNTFFASFGATPEMTKISFLKEFTFSYTYLQKQKNAGELISAYTLDYLKHKITSAIEISLVNRLSIELRYSYLHRNGTYTFNSEEYEYKSYSVTDLGLSFQTKVLNIYAGISNVFGNQTADFGGILLPGRWINVGISINTRFEGNKF